MKRGGISGLAVSMVAVGGFLIWISLKDYSMLDGLRYALRGGRGPAPIPQGGGGIPAPSLPGGPSTGLTRTGRSPNPDAGIGLSSTKLPTQFQLPVSGYNKPLP